ncbi:unnamed protein product [marine sediment metagenome]|uniref:Uncharacterized protein n=1 Tax=marine sediment metagenome TaxID=412755 RepID=X1B427_9ZZZZ
MSRVSIGKSRRLFDGSTYSFESRSTRKDWAVKEARQLRRKGCLVRIVHRPNIKPDKYDGKKYRWALYVKNCPRR